MVSSSYYVVLTSHVTVLLSHSMIPIFFLTYDGIILILCSINITCDCTFVTFGGSHIFSHIWWYHPHIMQYQHHIWLYFCHIRWFPYFFSHLMVPSSHCAVLTSHVTVLLSNWWFSFFFLTFDGSIVTLSSTNTTYDRTFLTFAGTLIFSWHLTISLSHWAVPTSYVTVLLSHSIVPLFFFPYS